MDNVYEQLNILILEDCDADKTQLKRLLQISSLPVQSITSTTRLSDALEALSQNDIDIVLAGLNLHEENDCSTLQTLRKHHIDIPIVIVSHHDGDVKLNAITQGADDILHKHRMDACTLFKTAHYAIERRKAQVGLRLAKEAAEASNQELEQLNRCLQAAMERMNVLAHEAMVSNRAKTHFLNNMSHEIRTPLNAIMGFSELLAQAELKDPCHGYAQIVQESSLRLLKVINNILEISRLEADQVEIHPQACNLSEIVESIQFLYGPQLQEKGLSFSVQRSDSLPTEIHTDPVAIRQCLLSLVDNAVKFTQKGQVSLTIRVNSSTQTPMIYFDVVDTGVGIPSDKLKTIFDPFVQSDGASTRNFEGAGLGLAITRKLAKCLGGAVEARNRDGEGTVFTLSLPLSIPSEEETLEAKTVSENRPTSCHRKLRGKVLVAEDSRLNAQLIDRVLVGFGLEPTLVSDGQQAVEKAMSESFDLILMDIQMPNMNGYEATTTLRRQEITVPIIALTANALPEDRDRCMAVGCNEYLTKPFEQDVLWEILVQFLDVEEGEETKDFHEETPSEITSQGACSQSDDREPPVIDWEAFREIYQRDDVVHEMIDAFLQEASATMNKMTKAVREQKAKDVRMWAHKMKGSALTIAASPLAAVAYRLECAASQNEISVFQSILVELESAYRALLAYVLTENHIECPSSDLQEEILSVDGMD